MADWNRAIAFVLKAEGGYVPPSAKDPGGETNFGISKRWHKELDIKKLTKDEAIEIYNREYWRPGHCEILGDDLALCVFDTAVNCGLTKALKWKDDSGMEPERYLEIRETYYRELCKSPIYSRYLKGWLNRLDAIRKNISLYKKKRSMV